MKEPKKYLDFRKDQDYPGVTLVYDVVIKETAQHIGRISYHSDTWRYVFWPEPNIPLGRTTMRETADFIQVLMDQLKEHRRKQKEQKEFTINPNDLF